MLGEGDGGDREERRNANANAQGFIDDRSVCHSVAPNQMR